MSSNLVLNPKLREVSPDTGTTWYLSAKDALRVWIVKSGTVDIFLQDILEGEDLGARSHVLRVEQGQALFGLYLDPSTRAALVASLHPGTLLSAIDLASFSRSGELSSKSSQTGLLYEWIHKLYAASTRIMMPKEHQRVKASDEVSTENQRLVVVPDDDIVWISHANGGSQFCGTEIKVTGPKYLPVSKPQSGWLQLAENTSIVCADFDEVREQDPRWEWLQHFHHVLLHYLRLERQQTEQEERERIKAQRDSDATLAHRTLLHLASPLIAGEARPGQEVISKDPLLLACSAIGSRMEITFKAASEEAKGTSEKHSVEAIAKASNVRSRRVLLRDEWWKQNGGPLLAFQKEDNRPIALLPKGDTAYQAYDPVENRTTAVGRNTTSRLGPFAYIFYRPFPAARLNGKDLLLFALRVSKRELLMVGLMGITGGVLSLVFPIATGIIFDRVIPGADRYQLLQITALLLASAVAMALFALVRNFAVLRVEARVDASLQGAMWDRVLRLPARFFRDFSSGDLAVRSLAMNQIRQLLTNATLSSILSGMFSVFSFALLFYYSWPLALLATGLAGLALVVSAISAYVQLRYAKQLAPVRGAIASMLLQFINGITKLRVSGTENRAFAAWAFAFARQKDLYMKMRQQANRLTVFNSTFPVFALLIIFWAVGIYSDQSGSPAISTGAFLAFLAAFIQFLTAILQLTSTMVSILGIVPMYERALPILQTQPEVDEGKVDPGELKGALEVNHVTFRYGPVSPLVLRDISLMIRQGEFVAFTGPSGSGKSTLLRLLLAFEQPESGTISYDGQDVSGLDVQAVRQQIGVVLQSGRLIAGTVFDNIVGSLPLSHDDAWEAARMAGLDQDIKAMPMGMHTFVSEGGGGFSGGQRQRLMIARAIVNKPRILFFDEATSALDNQTQAIVSRSLQALRATRVVIAHRLSTIINADQIFVFDKGAIVQNGRYSDLLRQPGLFRDLVQRQML